jgi:outer membrane protein
MSKSLRGRLLAAIFTTGVVSATAVGPACAETLADAVALAYDSNPTLQSARATQRALDETYVQARAGWRPTVTLAGTAQHTEDRVPRDLGTFLNPGGISHSNAASASVTVSQPLYTGGRVGAAVSAAEADILAGRESLRRVEAQVLASVIQAYIDVRRDQESLSIRQANVRVLTDQLAESNARYDVGEITKTDVAQSQARLAGAQAQLQSALAQLATSRANYAAVVGQNPGDLAPEPSLVSLMPTDVDQAFDVAEDNNPQIRQAEFAEQASRARLAGAKAERLPNISLQGRYSQSGPGDPMDSDRYVQNVTGTVNVTVPLFSGGLVSSRIRQTSERNSAARIDVEGARRTVLQNITQAWNLLIAARANIGSTAEQVRATRIAQEGTRQEQQVGLRTTIDVLNAELELRQAELAQVNARRDEYAAAAAVLLSMGRLEAKNLIPTVARYDPATNFGKLRITWGWVPWEEPVGVIDSLLTPKPQEKPVEGPVTNTPLAQPAAAPAAN